MSYRMFLKYGSVDTSRDKESKQNKRDHKKERSIEIC